MGHLRGPAHGLPILLKDLIDVKGMYTSAGNYSLRNSFPPTDSGHRQEAARARRRDPRQARPVGVRQQLRQPALRLQQPDRPGPQRPRHRRGPERLVVRHRRGRRRRRCRRSTVGTETSGSIICPRRRTGSSACARPSGSCPATASRRSPPRRTPRARWSARVADAALTCSRSPGLTPTATPSTRRSSARTSTRCSRRRPRRCRTTCRALDLNFVQRQADRLQRHAHRRHAAEDRLRRARGGGRDHGLAADDRRGQHARAPDRLRGAQDDRRVLQAARPDGADPLARRGGRRQPGQRAGGAEVRQRHAPQRLARRTSRPAGRTRSRTGRTCRCARPPGTRRSTT